MRRGRVTAVLVGAVGVWAALLAGATNAGAAVVVGAVPAGGSWSRTIEVPGLGALNVAGRAEVLSVSCGSAGNCAAGGSYWDRRRHLQGFVVSELNGTWQRAIEVPGLAALNVDGFAEVLSVSCGSAGNCAAGGDYYDRNGQQQGFVVSEVNGTWGAAIEVPGLAALNVGGFAQVLSVSCGSAGNCAAGGYYYDPQSQEGFVVSEVNGTWDAAIEVPGLAALNTGFNGLSALAEVSSVSCGPAGNCVAGGSYQDLQDDQQAFVVSAQNGTWGTAIEVPRLGALNAGGQAGTTSVWCGSAGNCAAGGGYQDPRGHGQGFVVTEQNGTWGQAIPVPGLALLNAGGHAGTTSVWCGSPGNCAAGGGYEDRHGHGQGFVVTERSGTWGRAIPVPGLALLNVGGRADVWSLSCVSVGNCAAGGSYLNRQGDQQGFVVSKLNGTWQMAIEVPGLGSLNDGVAAVSSVSCVPAGNCAAGGYYQDHHLNLQGFVVSRS